MNDKSINDKIIQYPILNKVKLILVLKNLADNTVINYINGIARFLDFFIMTIILTLMKTTLKIISSIFIQISYFLKTKILISNQQKVIFHTICFPISCRFVIVLFFNTSLNNHINLLNMIDIT